MKTDCPVLFLIYTQGTTGGKYSLSEALGPFQPSFREKTLPSSLGRARSTAHKKLQSGGEEGGQILFFTLHGPLANFSPSLLHSWEVGLVVGAELLTDAGTSPCLVPWYRNTDSHCSVQ